MATVTMKGKEVHTNGKLPEIGTHAPEFKLTNTSLQEVSLKDLPGKVIMSIFPSIDTPVCALSTKKFNDYARKNPDVTMLMVSADLPFAMSRFCANEGLENVRMLSMMRDRQFAEDYGVLLTDGPMAGLTARAVLVLNANHVVKYAEMVPEIGQEPDYDKAIKAL